MDIWFVIVFISLFCNITHCTGTLHVKPETNKAEGRESHPLLNEFAHPDVRILNLSSDPACSPSSRPIRLTNGTGEFGISAEHYRRMHDSVDGQDTHKNTLAAPHLSFQRHLLDRTSNDVGLASTDTHDTIDQKLPHDLFCEWLVYATAPALFSIDLDWVLIGEQDGPCHVSASVSVYEQKNDHSVPPTDEDLLGRTCWHDPFLYPLNFESTKPLRIIFRTDKRTTGFGFGAKYSIKPREEEEEDEESVSVSATVSPSYGPSPHVSETPHPSDDSSYTFTPSIAPIPTTATPSESPQTPSPFVSVVVTPTQTPTNTDRDCELSDWSPWSSCVPLDPDMDPCGSGIRTRNRSIVNPPTGAGKPCPPVEELKQNELCQVPCFPPACAEATRPVTIAVPDEDLVIGTPPDARYSPETTDGLSTDTPGSLVYLPPGTLCEWHVPPESHQTQIGISLDWADLPYSPDCSSARLSIYSFLFDEEVLLNGFCGKDVPSSWVYRNKQDSLISWLGDGFIIRLTIADAPTIDNIENKNALRHASAPNHSNSTDGVPVGLWIQFFREYAYATLSAVPPPPSSNSVALISIPCTVPCPWTEYPTEAIRGVTRSLPYNLHIDPRDITAVHIRPTNDNSALMVLSLVFLPSTSYTDTTFNRDTSIHDIMDIDMRSAVDTRLTYASVQEVVRELWTQLADKMSPLHQESWTQHVNGSFVDTRWIQGRGLTVAPDTLEIPLPLTLTSPPSTSVQGVPISWETNNDHDEWVYHLRVWNSGSSTLVISDIQLVLPTEFSLHNTPRQMHPYVPNSSTPHAHKFATLETVPLPSYLHATEDWEHPQNTLEIALRLRPEHAPTIEHTRDYHAHVLVFHSGASTPYVFTIVFPASGKNDTSLIDRLFNLKSARDALIGTVVVLLVFSGATCVYLCRSCKKGTKHSSPSSSISSSVSSESSREASLKTSALRIFSCLSFLRTKKQRQGYSPPTNTDDDTETHEDGDSRRNRGTGREVDSPSSDEGADSDADGDDGGALITKHKAHVDTASISKDDKVPTTDGPSTASKVVLEMTELPGKASNTQSAAAMTKNTPNTMEVNTLPPLSLANIPGPFGRKNTSASTAGQSSSSTASSASSASSSVPPATATPSSSSTNASKSHTITSGGATAAASSRYSDQPTSPSPATATATGIPQSTSSVASGASPFVDAFRAKPHLKPSEFEKKWTELPAVEVWGCTLATKPGIPQMKSTLAAHHVACMASGVFQGIEKYFFYVQSNSPQRSPTSNATATEPDIAIAEVSVAIDTQRLSALIRASSENLGAQLLEVLQFVSKEWEK